jgi:hypothetical protein
MAVIQSKGASASKKPRKSAVPASKAKKAAAKPTTAKPYKRHNPKPPFVPTNDQRKIVEMGIFSKMTERQICTLIINPATDKPIALETLRKVFKDELAEGEAAMIARVRANMVNIALDKKHKGCVTAGIWVLKTRAGEREPPPEWQLRRMEAEAAKSAAIDGEGNETVTEELVFTLKLEEDRPPPVVSTFDYSQPQTKRHD